MSRQATNEDIIRLHSQGLEPARIAAEFGLDVETVEYVIDRAYWAWAGAHGYDN